MHFRAGGPDLPLFTADGVIGATSTRLVRRRYHHTDIITSFSVDALRVLSESSNASSNTDELDETDTDRPVHVGPACPKSRTPSDCFGNGRACLLIRGFPIMLLRG
jgi:hypothetical protein